ncbi:hypothetical protein ACJDU8_02440 [Clostridium sp. WILCCON 0269]|uniref:DUF5659 domain-containing protein n=1 Tax=Candidatus Clostridium eludens TaxID=3381663 RepID=A0ABW8SEP5_9CLOT
MGRKKIIIKGDVFVAKTKRLCKYLTDKGFKMKREDVDDLNPNYNVYIFNNSAAVRQAVAEYFLKQ